MAKVQAVNAWTTNRTSQKGESVGIIEPVNVSTDENTKSRNRPKRQNYRETQSHYMNVFNKYFSASSRGHAPISLSATHTTSFPFTIPSDSDRGAFKHNRVTTLPDDRVVVLDRNNNKLKLFSPDYQFLHHVTIPGRGPFGIDYANGLTSVDKSTVAVSCGGTYNCVNMYSVDTTGLQLIKSLRRRDKSGDLLDIAYTNNAFICLISHNFEFARTIELLGTGRHKRTILKEKGLFSVYTDIIAGEQNRFYVSYNYPNLIRCFSFEGTQLWNVSAPTGVAGMALVAGRLCVILENGIMRTVSLEGHVCSDFNMMLPFIPDCMCYQKQANRLIVTYCPRYGRIRVFTMC